MKTIYKPVVHDGPDNFDMERQIWLLAMAGAAVWKEWMKQNPTIKPAGEESTPMEVCMRQLYQQLDKTDIFMGGYHAPHNPL